MSQLERFYLALDDEYVFLLEFFLEPLFQCRQELTCLLLVGRNHAVDDNLITVCNPPIVQKPAFGWGKKVRPPN